MKTLLGCLASVGCSAYYATADVTGWWLLAAVAMLVYAWRHRAE